MLWPMRPPRPLDVAPTPPSSHLAQLAEQAAARQNGAVLAHAYRTCRLGTVLARQDKVELEPDVFYVGALLHDAGMTQAVDDEDFTIRSARLALQVCEEAQVPDRLTAFRIADAIVAHPTPGLTVDDDRHGFYIQAGAMADLGAVRMWEFQSVPFRRLHRPPGSPRAPVHVGAGSDRGRPRPTRSFRAPTPGYDGHSSLLHYAILCLVAQPNRLVRQPIQAEPERACGAARTSPMYVIGYSTRCKAGRAVRYSRSHS